MRTYKYLIVTIIMGLSFTSCNDFLDPAPTDRLSEKLFWQNEESTDLYLNSFYPYLSSYGNFGTSQFNNGLLTEGMTDMLKYGSYSAGVGNANRIVFNPYFVTADQSQGLVIWTTSYERIRRVNEFLSSMSKYSTYNEDTNKRYEAQIRFIRAFLYYQLLLRTNTVIIFDKLPDGNSKPLSPESDCWDFVEQDLDYAIQNLPVQWDATRSGRITKGAALAMKSRAMLLAKRWEKARAAASEVINLQDNGSLVYELNKDYKNAFKSYFDNGNKESILEFRYKLPAPYHSFDRDFAPGGDWANNGGSACPTQEMVEEYELATGGKADWSKWHSKTTETPPYSLLEPRFHASVLYNGASWKNRKIETFVDGKDGYIDYGFQANTNGKTTTGYYLRKYLDESIADISTTYSAQPWIEIRLAEVYLNLAEACAMLGSTYDKDANNAIRTIRERVKLPYTDLTGEELMKAIRHERKVELAYEGFYYWDLRRWRMADSILDGVRFHGLKITQSGTTLTYEYIDCDKEDRKFPERFYNFPIPTTEIANNLAISQINLW
ncbi:RagB/SusD family nutrient uptake outer membrane protein [Bacteroides thetaiotaomicron]|uniref:RagB/SusD family nutrient uptake outer membrane protein n=1 Tax=Bacteroides thetaiotaomicron TaxID=818 RepID=UPI0021644BC4|nr:RagB/SusD family nutrient uptake outer membrane protein [Bacteroides thetaiotaomicron]UVP43478.1 RagB/SusD family nutrient uptake outer membrane protein [Bacteroides thetaiotaomicron]